LRIVFFHDDFASKSLFLPAISELAGRRQHFVVHLRSSDAKTIAE